jgi:quinoprotein glucose dehydrogenase
MIFALLLLAGLYDDAQFSPSKQVNKSNVAKLELAWRFAVPGTTGRFGFRPLVVDGTMYVLGPQNAIVALDAATGKTIWTHPVEGGRPTDRGINYWNGRLIFAVGPYLQQIDAKTGVTVGPKVDLRIGDSDRRQGGPTGTPGRVFEDLILLGSAPGENYGSALGDLRAYNLRTGKMAWIFHTIPRPGEFGYDTWPPEAYKTAGGANTWGEITLDEKRGIAYFPTGSPTYDFYGADRHGANLFANCLIALDARTGKRLWHFQVVHHDLWDYDLATGPKLLTVKHDGKMVDAVAQVTKFGFVYVFDRVTGKPLWPIEERPVPQSDVPGEKSSATQPFPTWPEAFTRQRFTEADINPYIDDADKARLRQILKTARNEGLFTPPATRNTIDMPGELGGSNWGGAAADLDTGWLYVRSHDAPTMHILSDRPRFRVPEGATLEQRGRAIYGQHCEGCHGSKLPPLDEIGQVVRNGRGQMPRFDELTLPESDMVSVIAYIRTPSAGVLPSQPAVPGRYYTPYGTLNASNGLPAIGPPWSELTAYDLNTGDLKWQVPLGDVKGLGLKGVGSYHPTRNGLVVTAGGLLFIGTWSDRMLRAFDKDTGKILWEKEIEANPEGIPTVYETGGKQYIAFCTRAGRVFDNVYAESVAWSPGKPEAAGYYVFRLP